MVYIEISIYTMEIQDQKIRFRDQKRDKKRYKNRSVIPYRAFLQGNQDSGSKIESEQVRSGQSRSVQARSDHGCNHLKTFLAITWLRIGRFWIWWDGSDPFLMRIIVMTSVSGQSAMKKYFFDKKNMFFYTKKLPINHLWWLLVQRLFSLPCAHMVGISAL